jgi:RNA polymerase sigma factor (TIGR02999 family)
VEPVESTDVTTLLQAWGRGDRAALDRLTERLYDELRRMAKRYMQQERAGQTLQATALINEVYLRLVDFQRLEWQQRAQFFALSAQIMRHILVDAARARRAHKRGGGAIQVSLDEALNVSPENDESFLALNEAFEALSEVAPRQAKVIELRYFGGLSEEETAEVMKTSPRTVSRDWQFARAWLMRQLRDGRPATYPTAARSRRGSKV